MRTRDKAPALDANIHQSERVYESTSGLGEKLRTSWGFRPIEDVAVNHHDDAPSPRARRMDLLPFAPLAGDGTGRSGGP